MQRRIAGPLLPTLFVDNHIRPSFLNDQSEQRPLSRLQGCTDTRSLEGMSSAVVEPDIVNQFLVEPDGQVPVRLRVLLFCGCETAMHRCFPALRGSACKASITDALRFYGQRVFPAPTSPMKGETGNRLQRGRKPMTTKISAKTETRLVEALLNDTMIAREIRAITKWDGEHLSIRNAVARVAARNELRVKVSKVPMENGTKLLGYQFVKPTAKPVVTAKAAATKRSSKKTAD
jgi:hypothetical protein